MCDKNSRYGARSESADSAPMFPLFVSLEGKRIAVVGGGASAFKRIRTLVKFGAEILIIAPDIAPETALLVQNGRISWLKSEFSPPLLEGSDLVIAATGNRGVNRLVGETAKRMRMLVCVADRQNESSFCFPSVIQGENIVVGVISSNDDIESVKNIVRKICGRFGKGRRG